MWRRVRPDRWVLFRLMTLWPSGSRIVWAPIRPALLCSLVALVLAGCGDPAASGVVERAEAPRPTLVLDPDDGRLQVRVDGLGSRAGLDHVLLVGDSVLVLAADDLGLRMGATLHVDAVDCRRLDRGFTGPCGGVPAGVAVAGGLDALSAGLDELADDDIVPDAVVLVVANNAALEPTDLDRAMSAVPDGTTVWWVTTRVADRGWQDPNNAALAALADRDPDAKVIDWFAASEGRDEWLADSVHPNEVGQRALARLIADHVRCDCTP